MDSNEILRECFKEVGGRYGYDRIEAQFVAYKDFKVRWQRSYKWADFRVSDYLMDAPEGVLKALALSLFRRIAGEDDDAYSQEMCDWVTSSRFYEAKQQVYLRRSKSLLRSPAGDHKNLRESYERLVDMGLAEEDPSIYVTWTKEAGTRKVGHCSVLMRVVSISRALDEEAVPDYVLDYCLYHELCHIVAGFDPTGNGYSDKYEALVSKFPEKADAEMWMRRLCVYI